MRLPGGIRTKLALALLAIVGGALTVAYAIVIPTLAGQPHRREARPARGRRVRLGDPTTPVVPVGHVPAGRLVRAGRARRRLLRALAQAGHVERGRGLARSSPGRRGRPDRAAGHGDRPGGARHGDARRPPVRRGGVRARHSGADRARIGGARRSGGEPRADRAPSARSRVGRLAHRTRARLRGRLRARPAHPAARARGGTDCRGALRRARHGRQRRRARRARARRSTACACSWRSWTRRARSSSPTPRTSCARRSSRSAASSS